MKKTLGFVSLIGAMLFLQSCNKLTGEAKEIVGIYVIPEISSSLPVMELNRDATCVVRAIRPGVITYSVKGTWNVENDSLVMNLERATLEVEGDETLVGEIPERSARKVVEHSDLSLELENDGILYYYKRINQ